MTAPSDPAPKGPLGRAGTPIGLGIVAVVLVVTFVAFRAVLNTEPPKSTPTPPAQATSPGGAGGSAALASDGASPPAGESPPAQPSGAATSPSTEPSGPTGTIALTEGTAEAADIFTATLDGGTEPPPLSPLVTRAGNDIQLAWSRDNGRIVWVADGGLAVASAGGGDPETISPPGSKDVKPEWSPDDSAVVFARKVGDYDLQLYSFSSGAVTPLIDDGDDGYDDLDPSWSPVTNRIAIVSTRSGDEDIWTIAPNGDDAKDLTGPDGVEVDPAWSPDGTTIAYASTRVSGTFAIWLVPAEGGEPLRATTGSREEHDPTWSPDGRFLAIARADPSEIVIVDVATKADVMTISEDGGTFKFPAWQH